MAGSQQKKKAKEKAAELTAQAKEQLVEFSDNEFLMGLTDLLLERRF